MVYGNEAVAQSIGALPRCGQTCAEASKRTARDKDVAEAKAALSQVAESQKRDAVAFRVFSRLAEGESERPQVACARGVAPGQNLINRRAGVRGSAADGWFEGDSTAFSFQPTLTIG
jgi:hypothetical protein